MIQTGCPEVAATRARIDEITSSNRCHWPRLLCSAVALLLGAVAAWASRTMMYPDGISYIDIGDAYWRGDWHNALNAYWSPLYSWILGAVLKLFRPSIQDEFPLIHVINFLQYVIALVAFNFFLDGFVQYHAKVRSRANPAGEMALPVGALYVAGYAAFVTASLFLITISFTSPDMTVAALIYFVLGLLLKIHSGGRPTRTTFVLLGFALGLGFYAKTAMFPIGFVFLIVAAIVQKRGGRSLKPVALSLTIFLLTSAPFISALSISKGRPTFGDSGTINYTVNVGTVQFFIPHEPGMFHPVTRIPGTIEAYEYAGPIAGTYPLWYDPTYWHEGIHPHFNLRRQLRTIALALAESCWVFFNTFFGLHLSVAVLFLYLIASKPSACLRSALTYWIVWIPAAAGIALYGLVVIEPRYLGAQFCVLWIVAFAGVRLPCTAASSRLITTAVLLAAFLTCAIAGREIWRTSHGIGIGEKNIATPECPKVAAGLLASGVHSGDKIAVVSDWLFPSREGAYIARLARVQIMGEARPGDFWAADECTRAELSRRYAHDGATALFTHNPPATDMGWQRLADTDYYVHLLSRHSSNSVQRPAASGAHAGAPH